MSAGLYFGKFRSWETLLEWANVFVFHKIQSISFKSFTEMRKTAKSVNFYSILNLDYIIDSNMFCLLSFFELNKFPCFIMMMMMMMMMVHMFANLYIYTTYSPVPNIIGGKFCCRKPTISKELWTISLSYLLQSLPIRIRIVEISEIKASREFVVQWGMQQIKIQLRYFFAEVICW